MFPTEPIRLHIQLSFATKIDETAQAYRAEIVSLRTRMSPNVGLYYQSFMQAGIHLQEAKVKAYIAIVREACHEAGRPVDNEVRAFMLSEIHNMCEAGKGQVANAVRTEITRGGDNFPASALPALMDVASRRISQIETQIKREFKIEELKEGIKQSGEVSVPLETAPLSKPIPVAIVDQVKSGKNSGWTRDQKIALGSGIVVAVLAAITVVVMLTTPELRIKLHLDKPANVPSASPNQPAAIDEKLQARHAYWNAEMQVHVTRTDLGNRYRLEVDFTVPRLPPTVTKINQVLIYGFRLQGKVRSEYQDLPSIDGDWKPGDRARFSVEVPKNRSDPTQGWNLIFCVGSSTSCIPSINLLTVT